uniref:Serine-threonine/tyrosine-protein kinase catalytic domain-containing protein n=1 Tax=Solanum lycopersicum TaxID=4081 RepID=A0A3Q7IHQ5_SOLLC
MCIAKKIGRHDFSNVYKGVLEKGIEITGKKQDMTSRHGHTEFDNEVKLIPNVKHRNLTKISGYCINGAEKFLVYEFMVNNSLGKDPLRLAIVQDLALDEVSH